MATKVRLLGRVLVFDALELRIEALHDRGEQAVETEPLTLFRRECGALVQKPIHQDRSATRCHRHPPYDRSPKGCAATNLSASTMLRVRRGDCVGDPDQLALRQEREVAES
jgi:hypothetical protein